ncbi:uncharacterized protein LOC126872736 [Bombus huntii]|uniref:uncharacterized protein LOC126872736 n=1 Tax=Bombus huntii TaxID=85661 RepID=UPI0021AA5E49|nr:uncharacterized protein LOC126872736 [Bombus huntii]
MDKRSERVSRFKRAGVSEARGAMNRVDHWRPKGDPSPSSARNGDTIRRCRRKASASGAIVEDQQTMMGWCSVKCSPCEQRKPTPKRMRMDYHTLGRDRENAASGIREKQETAC